MAEELKSCPFCGSEGIISYNTRFGWQVFCTNEECFMNDIIVTRFNEQEDKELEVIKAWNRRANDGRNGVNANDEL